MSHYLSLQRPQHSIVIELIPMQAYEEWQESGDPITRRWLESTRFKARAGAFSLIPDKDGNLATVLVVIDDPLTPWSIAHLPQGLPEGDYHLGGRALAEEEETRVGIGWALAQYRFISFKTDSIPARNKRLTLTEAALTAANRQIDAVTLVRDLANTPAESLSPLALSDICREVANSFGATCKVIQGDDLLIEGFPAVHVVGRASHRPSCLIDMRWGDETHPGVTLVGKGVCFDTGGLDLKPASAMRLMKKDMGGAAHALALGQLIMQTQLPVRLRVLIPAVDNAVAGNAYRPGDVIETRAGISVEIDNTDAEGRIILSDALAAAGETSPQLIIDFATLTGAARVALGPELPAMFTNSEELAKELIDASSTSQDPLWRMPLYSGYRELLDSRVGDLVNAPTSPFAGAITAALFLERFVTPDISWAHFDLMAWNHQTRPGRPEGGEAMGLRAVFAYLAKRYRVNESAN